MSRRTEYLSALTVALVKDNAVVLMDALRVLEKAAALPDDSFPLIRADDVRQFVRYALGEEEAPAWVSEALEERVTDADPRLVIRSTHGECSETWFRNASAVRDTLSTDLRVAFTETQVSWGLESTFELTPEQWDRLRAWVEGIPGELECERPFEVVEGVAEDHEDEG